MNDSAVHRPFPRSLLLGAAVLIGLALIGIVAVRAMGLGTGSPPPGPAVMSRDLFFVDRPDGGVDVVDANAAAVARLAPGTNGFMRATLRGLVRERRRNGLGPKAPFRLTAHADGRLTLQDTATGRLLDLEAFGATNAGAFATLLAARPDA